MQKNFKKQSDRIYRVNRFSENILRRSIIIRQNHSLAFFGGWFSALVYLADIKYNFMIDVRVVV